LQAEEFDAVVNLEKVPGICALADSIKAWRKYGFRFHSATGTAEAYDRAFEVLAVSSSPNAKKENKRTVQELLFEMVGAHWQEEGYILGYQSQTREEWDVGLNSQVGQKWPTKMWPHEYWKQLEKLLGERGLRVSRQDNQPKEVLSDLYKYMDWIHSCRTIVSNDSLGMHLGIAMQKKVFGLFGPTPDKEVYFYGRGKAILPEKLPDCAPCFKNQCARELLPCCMDLISPDGVANEVLREYSH
jgi:heptosyltransferase-2